MYIRSLPFRILSLIWSPVIGFLTLYSVTALFLWDGQNRLDLGCAIVVSPLLIWLSICDLRRYELPDLGTASIAIIACLYLAWTDVGALLPHIITGIVVMGGLWLWGEFYYRKHKREGIGIGDAKLFGAGACLLGPWHLPDLLLISSLGGILVVSISSFRAVPTQQGVPFGPFISYAIFLLIFLDPIFL